MASDPPDVCPWGVCEQDGEGNGWGYTEEDGWLCDECKEERGL